MADARCADTGDILARRALAAAIALCEEEQRRRAENALGNAQREAGARAVDTLGFVDAATTVEHTLREIDSCLLQARGRRGGVDRV